MARKGIDYSKWDNFKDSDDEEEQQQPPKPPVPAQAPDGSEGKAVKAEDLPDETKKALIKDHPEMAAQAGLLKQTVENKSDKKRKQFWHEGRLIYEWEQSLDEVNIYIESPPGVKADMFDITIKADHLNVGIKGSKDRYLNHTLGGRCKNSESYWTLEDKELHITLTKLDKATPWDCALKGHDTLDPLTATEVRKDIMRERFQEEHPGFDFSGAEFNGQVPDPSKFMGGMSYK
mmetsp:Transcript_38605/g.60229  ORF Transcript_38605/g.60229 Transcript_38605/m.60229 type:complete len:233 (-) Transcript_38605:1570-2268(-)